MKDYYYPKDGKEVAKFNYPQIYRGWKKGFLVLFIIFVLGRFVVEAGVLDGFVSDVKSAGTTVWNVTKLQPETFINGVEAATGQAPPSTILDPAKDLAHSSGQLIQQSANTVTLPQAALYKEAQDLASKAGTPGNFVFDIATFSQRYQLEFNQSAAQAAGNILQGNNLLQIVSTPLAAAIREAHDNYQGNAYPLPDDVKAGLAHFFSQDVLNRAKYAVGNVEITLPNGIGKTEKFFDKDYAVVVDDIIVFNTQPPSFQDNPWWWGHEVTHVEQYSQYGIDKFAQIYVGSGGADIENPANQRGTLVLQYARNVGMVSFAGNNVSLPEPTLPHALYSPPVAAPNTSPTPLNGAQMAPPDPIIIQYVFPGETRPISYYGTRSGRIVVMDRSTGQWVQIGFAAPKRFSNTAWTYQAGSAIFDVLYTGQIMQWTPGVGTSQVGYILRIM